MSDATRFAKLGHLMLKKEATEGVAVFPDVALEILSESVVTNWDFTAANTIAGNRSANLRPIKNQVGPATGSIELLIEPNQVGRFLTGLFGEATDTTLEASTIFQHDFEPGTTLQTYTFDLQAADDAYSTRYFGVVIESFEISIDENKVMLTLNVQAQRAFTNARVTTAASSGTALLLDQTSGLTTSDTILVFDGDNPDTLLDTLAITTVTDENTLVTATITGTLKVNDIVVIQSGTPSYNLSNELIWSGGASVSIANGANGIQNLSTANNVEEVTITVTNDIEPRWSASGKDVIDRFPSEMLIKSVAVEGSFTRFHKNQNFLDMLRELEQVTLRFDFCGNALSTNSAASATGQIETDGSETITVTVDAAAEAGNDYAIVFTDGNGSLTATLAGKLITVNLDATGGNNTTTLVAAAIDALSGISAPDTGTDLVTVTDNVSKIHFASGRDANEVELLRIDLPDVRLNPYNANMSGDDIVNEEISFTAYRDVNDAREIQVRLRNGIADY